MRNADLVFYLKNSQIFIWKNTDWFFFFIKNRPVFYKENTYQIFIKKKNTDLIFINKIQIRFYK